MQDNDALSGAQRELELALRSVPPSSSRLDPIAAAFNAGRRSVRGSVHRWRSAAALALLIGAASWLAPARHSATTAPPESSGFMLAVQPPPSVPRPLSDQSVLALQEVVRKKGMDDLPAPHLPAVKIVRAEDLF